MKVFHLFQGSDYYPGGGMVDYKGSFATAEDAKAARKNGSDWAEIVITEADGSLKLFLRWKYGNYWVIA